MKKMKYGGFVNQAIPYYSSNDGKIIGNHFECLENKELNYQSHNFSQIHS